MNNRYQVSEEFKQSCKENIGLNRYGKIHVVEDDLDIEGEQYDGQLVNFTIEDDCYVEDKFIGTTVAKKITVNILNPENILNLENKTIETYAGIYINEKLEEIPYGNYIIEKPDNEEVKEKTSFTGYDYMIKFNVPYKDRVKYPIKLSALFEDVCDQVGLEAGNIDFINADYMVLGNPFTNGEDCRTVLSNIAQLAGGFAKIGRDNKVYIISLKKQSEFAEKITANNYFEDFSKNDCWGELNSLVIGLSDIEGENTAREDKESIEKNGLTEITIEDNYFLINEEEREKVIEPLWENLKGLKYLPFKTKYYGYPYLDSGDPIAVEDSKDVQYLSYVFNHTFIFNGAFDGNLETTAMTKTQTAYKNTQDIRKRIKRAERKIDKVNGRIEDVIQETTENSEKISKHEQTIESMKDTISSVETKVETVETKADNAQSTANSASSKADSAEATANSAKESAENAVSQVETTTEKMLEVEKSLDGVSSTLSETVKKVETVEGKADSAQQTANTANTNAQNAQKSIETTNERVTKAEQTLEGFSQTVSAVETKIETVEQKADTAQTTADGAVSKANTAQSTADTAKTNAQNAQKTADTANTNAQNAQKTADNVSKEIVTTKERVTKAEQTLDGFSQTVSAVEKSIESTNTKIDNLDIGGTQILRGTNTFTSLGSSGVWSNSTWRKAGNGTGTKTAISVTDSPNGNIKKGAKIVINNTADNNIAQDSVPIIKGEEYTLSCYARLVSGTGNIKLQYGKTRFLSKTHDLTTSWKRYSWTFTSSTDANYYNANNQTNIYFGNSTASDGTIEVCGMKLEKGNKDTDWSESPEDIENNIQTIKETVETTNERLATAEQTLDGFKQTVSSVETKVETVEKTANTAKNTADTAKSTADTANSTANTAKSTADKANTNANTALEQSKTTSQKVATMEETVEGFSQTVSSVQETLETTNAKVDNLEIGSTQILRGTNTFTTLGSSGTWANATWRKAGLGTGTKESISVTDSPNANIKRGARIICVSPDENVAQNDVPIVAGQTYTISCYARLVNGTGDIRLQYGKTKYLAKTYTLTSTTWTKYSWTFTASAVNGYLNTSGQTNIYIGGTSEATNNYTFEICGMKLEKGNKATDWSECPEDVEAKFTNYYTKEEANTAINQKITDSEASITASVNKSISTAKTEAINSANTNTANKLKDYSTKTEMNTAITQKISDSEASITSEVNKKIDGLEFGGTQLLRGTGEKFTKAGTGKWTDFSWRTASGGNGTKTFITVTNLPNGNIKKGVRITRTDTNNTNANDLAQDAVPVANGQTYTMSCYAKKNSGDGVLKMQYGKSPYPSKTFNLTTAWAHYSFTFTIGEKSDGSTDGNTNIYFGATAKTGVVELCGFKLEKGNRESDWSPAPEDMEATFTELSSKIEQTEKDISAEVSGKIAESEKTLTAKIDLKLDTKNLISQINASADQINLKAGRLVITAGNFTLDANGKIKAVSGTVGGFTLSSSNFSSSINGVYNYDNYDTQKVISIVFGKANISGALKNILDVNGDGNISIADAGQISKILDGSVSNTKKWTGTFKINANDPKHCVAIMTGSTTCVSLGLGGVDALAVTTQTLMCGTVSNNNFNGTVISSSGLYANKIYRKSIEVPQLQYGGALVKPSAANTPTGVAVTWESFSSTPKVYVSAFTAAPGTTVTGVSFSNPTTSGCTVYGTRTNTSQFTINWLAVGT